MVLTLPSGIAGVIGSRSSSLGSSPEGSVIKEIVFIV